MNSSIQKISLVVGLFVLTKLVSCQVKIKDFNPDGETKLAINALVTDSGSHVVVLTRSQRIETPITLTTPGLYLKGNEATVIISDGQGLVDTFQFSSNPLRPYFLPSKSWKGVPGRTYTLTVIAEGKTYTASDQMPNNSNFQIDSLYPVYRGRIIPKNGSDTVGAFDFNQSGFFTQYIRTRDSVFFVRLIAPKMTDQEIYIRSLVFNDLGTGTLDIPFNNPTRIYVANSQQASLNRTYIIPPSAGPPTFLYFKRGQKVTLVLQGMSRNAYGYFSALNSALNNDGGLFSAPPGNPASNISNGALGVFYCVQTITKSVNIGYTPGANYTDIPNPNNTQGRFKFE